MTPKTAGSTCFGPTIAYETPHELVESKSHETFEAILVYESELPDDIINERMLVAAEPKLSLIL